MLLLGRKVPERRGRSWKRWFLVLTLVGTRYGDAYLDRKINLGDATVLVANWGWTAP